MRLGETRPLIDVSLRAERGELLAIVGASGAGKTTLLGIIGLLETPTSGRYLLRGRSVAELSDAERAGLRNRAFGFVFQQFSLMPDLNVWQNVARPLAHAGLPKREQRERAMRALEEMELAELASRRPSQLSAGEQQRVAIARALVNDPEIVLADEPTANLPAAQFQPIVEGLERLCANGRTVIIATHDAAVVARASRVLLLSGGRLVEPDSGPDRGSPDLVPGAATTRRSVASDDQAAADLWLSFLGGATAARGSKVVALTARQAELLALLAMHPDGLSGEQLLLLAYGEDGRLGTLKSSLSRLRPVAAVASQPYRLDEPHAADFVRLLEHLKAGDVAGALDLYGGPLLPRSAAPGIVEAREHIDESLRRAVIAAGDGEHLLSLAERLTDDLELWELAAAALGEAGDPRHPVVEAAVERTRRRWT